jgi:hypothetical protein
MFDLKNAYTVTKEMLGKLPWYEWYYWSYKESLVYERYWKR